MPHPSPLHPRSVQLPAWAARRLERRRGMPRWNRDKWTAKHVAEGAGVLRVTCCLMWSWLLPDAIARELYAAVAYHPSLLGAAAAAAAPLGTRHSALHVRRGDKVFVDAAYRDTFGRMSAAYFLRLMEDEGLDASAPVYVATDELDRAWFAPLASAFNLSFVEQLDQGALLTALGAFPQALWADVLAIIEQIICTNAAAFVGTLPSTLSGHVINARSVASGVARPLFVKLHETCCDPRTAEDLLRLPGVSSLGDVPCHPHAGNPWC